MLRAPESQGSQNASSAARRLVQTSEFGEKVPDNLVNDEAPSASRQPKNSAAAAAHDFMQSTDHKISGKLHE